MKSTKKSLKQILKKIPDDTDFIPDMNLFRETIFNINPSGNLEDSYKILIDSIDLDIKNNSLRPEDNNPYTFNYLIKKYDSYIKWWRHTYGDAEEKYIPKDDRLKNVYNWINDNTYKEIYSIKKNYLNDYIFGGFSEEVLLEKLKIFKVLIGKEKYEEPEPTKPIQRNIEKRSFDESSETPF